MSSTFYCPEAPTNTAREKCICVEYGDDPKECPYCSGQGFMASEESTAPQLNLTGSNTIAILELINVPKGAEFDEYGHWSNDQLPEVRRAIFSLLNRQSLLEKATIPPYDSGHQRHVTNQQGIPTISTGCRVISPGRGVSYYEDRLRRIDSIVAAAQELKGTVVWA